MFLSAKSACYHTKLFDFHLKSLKGVIKMQKKKWPGIVPSAWITTSPVIKKALSLIFFYKSGSGSLSAPLPFDVFRLHQDWTSAHVKKRERPKRGEGANGLWNTQSIFSRESTRPEKLSHSHTSCRIMQIKFLHPDRYKRRGILGTCVRVYVVGVYSFFGQPRTVLWSGRASERASGRISLTLEHRMHMHEGWHPHQNNAAVLSDPVCVRCSQGRARERKGYWVV